MLSRDVKKTTRDFGVTFVNPRIGKEINQWIGEVISKNDPERAERFRSYRKMFDQVIQFQKELSFPIHLVIEALYGCNYRCPQCYLGIPAMKKRFGNQGLMSMNDYRAIVDEAYSHYTPSIMLNGVNEPLLDPHLISRIQYAREKGFVDIHIHSNGELLDEKMSEALIDSGCTRLMISLDAFTPATFSKIRVGGNLTKVINNIQRFLEVRKKKGSDLPVFRVSFVRQKANESEVQPFLDYWINRADYIHFQTYMELLDTRGQNYFTDADSSLGDSFHCEQPWYSMFIRSNGDIHPCCSFMNYYLPMGKWKAGELERVWLDASYKQLRDLHKRGAYRENEFCKKCVEGMFTKES